MDYHQLLLGAVAASATYLFQRFFTWRGLPQPSKQATFAVAAGVGFVLYLVDWQFPWLFQEEVVNAFAKAMAIPGVVGVLSDLAKKTNPVATPSLDPVRVQVVPEPEPVLPPEELEKLVPYEIGEEADGGDGLPKISTKEPIVEDIPPMGDDLPTYKVRQDDKLPGHDILDR